MQASADNENNRLTDSHTTGNDPRKDNRNMESLNKQTAPLMMTRDEVATELQVSTKTVDNLWREGKIPPPSRIGRGIRFLRREIMQYITDVKIIIGK